MTKINYRGSEPKRIFWLATNHRATSCQFFPTVGASTSNWNQRARPPGSQIVSPPERAATDAQQAARHGDVVNHGATTEELSDVPHSVSSLCGLGLAGLDNAGLDRASPGLHGASPPRLLS